MNNEQEWIPCSERLPELEHEFLPERFWVAVCGFSRFMGEEPKYSSEVLASLFCDGKWTIQVPYGMQIEAWQPYYQPAPYVEPRHACKLCCGEKVLGKGKTCWRCGGRGDEAADGSDVVQKLSQIKEKNK